MNKNSKILVAASIFAVLLVVMVSVALAYAGRDVTLLSERELHLKVNGWDVQIPMKEDGAVYNLPCLIGNSDNIFLMANDPGASVKVEKKALKTGNDVKIFVDKLSDSHKLEVEITNGKDSRTIYFRTLSTDLPTIATTGSGTENSEYFITDTSAPAMYQLDGNGNVTFYTAFSKDTAKGRIFTDFKKHTLENGDIRYSYQLTDPDISTFGLQGYFLGSRYILNEKHQILGEEPLRMVGDDYKDDALDGQGFILLDNNHCMTESMVVETVMNIPQSPSEQGTRVAAAVIQEAQKDKVVFQWKSTDYPELYALSQRGNAYNDPTKVQDYLHMNAMVMDPADDNLIVSFKNADTIIKIDRKTGDIIWKLSGAGDEFGLTDAQKFTAQSDVTLAEDGSLVVFDGDRILRLKLDETAKKVTEYKEFTLSGKGSTAYGSAQKISDTEENYVIGWGSSTGSTLFTEVNFSTGKTGIEGYASGNAQTFRVIWDKAASK